MWSDVFGEFWFWALAVAFWARSALSAYGAPRRVIAAALTDRGAADFARDLVGYRFGRGSVVPMGLRPLKIPALGALAAYFFASGVMGDATSLALVAVLGPVTAADLALENRVLSALRAPRPPLEETREKGLGETDVGGGATAGEKTDPFADVLEQVWRVRLAATAVSVLATLAAAAAGAP